MLRRTYLLAAAILWFSGLCSAQQTTLTEIGRAHV